MTDVIQPDVVSDQGEVVMRRSAERHAQRRSAMIVAGSLLAGLVAVMRSSPAPFADGREPVITGDPARVRVGWAILAVLSVRFTDRPQSWAAVPAAALVITGTGLIVLAPGAAAPTALGFVWPPPLLALVVWMIVRARRQPSGRVQSWLLYPVFGGLALAAVGGAYETLRNTTDPVPLPRSRATDLSMSAGIA